jgi:hypothetical protein
MASEGMMTLYLLMMAGGYMFLVYQLPIQSGRSEHS